MENLRSPETKSELFISNPVNPPEILSGKKLVMRNEVLSYLHQIGLESDEYIVHSGATLAIFGIRFTGDIDLMVKREYFDKLFYEKNFIEGYNKKCICSVSGLT